MTKSASGLLVALVLGMALLYPVDRRIAQELDERDDQALELNPKSTMQ